MELFSPQGSVKLTKQVQVRFSQPMVSLGDPRPKEDIFKISCPLAGKARWIDSFTWVYEFEKELPGGVKCEFKLSDSLKTIDGQTLSGDKNFVFDTGGPSVQYSSPYSGNSIEEDQVFMLHLDAKPEPSSVHKFAYFSVQELSNRIPLEIVEGKDRKEILKASGYEDEENLILVRAKQIFLPDKNIRLVWGKGVRSEWGGELAEDQLYDFKVRPAFSANFSCERVNAKANCIPILPLSVNFSSPVIHSDLAKITLISKEGKEYPSQLNEATKQDKENSSYSLSFPGPFPENSEFIVRIPDSLQDETGRKLVNAANFPLTVKTGEFPPLVKFPAKFGILEANANPAIPVTLRNLDAQIPLKTVSLNVSGSTQKTLDPSEIQKWFSVLAKTEREKSIFATKIGSNAPVSLNFPKPNGKKPMEVVGIPLEKPGFYVVEFASDTLGASLLEKKGKMYVSAAALVTNLSVHFKWGKDSSLVWVTSLDKAVPESGVLVKIVDCKGVVRGTGVTGKEGTVKFGKISNSEVPYCGYHELGNGLTVFAQKGEDISFTSSAWDSGIESWRFNLPSSLYGGGEEIQSVVLDRTLFKAGETVHLKHFRRGHGGQGLTASDPKTYPKKVVIQHEGSGENFITPLVWSFPGSTESEFNIPKTAKLGTYKILYPYSEEEIGYGAVVGNFRVEEFRLPVLKGNIQLADGAVYLVSPKKAKVDLGLQYLSGGGASSFPVQIRGQVSPRFWSPSEEYSSFSFNPEQITVGRHKTGEESEEDSGSSVDSKLFQGEKLKLDEKGFGSFTFENLKPVLTDSSLEVEMEYLDPSGEIQTTYRSFPVHQSNLHLGIQPKGWFFSKDKVEMQILALDLKNEPKKNQKINVKAYSRSFYSNRRRLVGGYYAYDHFREVKDLGVYCSGKTNDKGILFCEGKAPETGEIIFSAEAEDDKGNQTNSVYSIWVASSEDSWFEATDHNRMDILPEKRSTEIGDTLKIQIRSPFREGTALVTVEREGVIDSFVQNVSGKEPVVSLPIKKEYAPNVYISVLLIRGRVGDPKPTAMIDLARPSFRLGIVPIKVGWKPYELSVNIKTNQSDYKVREVVTANIQVKDKNGKPPEAGGEVLVAVVDEALLELSPNPTWKLLDAMMGTRGLDVSTSTGQSQVIGRRHFGLKARPTGGGGGKNPTRNLFNTLLYWKGKIVLDKEGKANIRFPLNDSLTSFRVVAVASAGVQEFGTGFSSIQTTQDVQTFAGIPPVVREGDLVLHEYSLRNSTSVEQSLKLNLQITDTNKDSSRPKLNLNLPEKSVRLAPNSTASVSWNIKVPNDVEARILSFEAKNESGAAVDRLTNDQKVIPLLSERVYQAGLYQWENPVSETLQAPSDSIPNSSSWKLTAVPSLLGGMKSVESYFLAYPYDCMEQRVSKAVGLKSSALWQSVDSELGAYLDSYGLVKYFPKMERGSEVLTAYVLITSRLAGVSLNGDSVTRMTEALRGYVDGKIPGEPWSFGADAIIRKIIVIEALAIYETLDWDYVSPVYKNLELLPTASIISLSEISNVVVGMDPKVKSRLANVLRSRLNLQGTELVIADSNFANPWWILGSKDYTMAKLVLWTLYDSSYKKDMPKLIKGFLKKQRSGKWDTTLGNAYGVLVAERVGKIMESEKVTGGLVSVNDGKSEFKIDPNVNSKNSVSISVQPEQKNVSINYNGKGKPWIQWESKSKIPLKEALFSGYRIKRTIEPIQRKVSGKWTKGDILKIRLEITADSDKTWVVLEDPLPPGSLHIGRGLGRESKILAGKISQEQDFSPSFEERSFSHYRAYYEYLPQGNFVTEYTIQLNHPGEFVLPPTRIEAMYSPETFAELPVESLQISEGES
ncbi:alpha-2-macroglobulin family protein [Leptospira idonii]|uniref:alpha-2-macroglobulin family protein n=1 Tax=Leptospira idonii TaxID=1193500 RepID=UPI001FEABC5C|nr:MG2 domain-containing protein [Leptospira idonii]